MLKLFYAPGACSLAPHIALEEAGANFEAERIDLRAAQQKSPEYLAINPKGAVPALQTDRGVLTENPVILGWIAQTHPGADLAPAGDSFEYAVMQSFNTFLAASVHPNIGRLLFSRPPLEGDARQAAQDVAMGKLRLIEDKLFRGPWAMGERFTVADGYLCVFERWAAQAGLISDGSFPRMIDHLQRTQARPAVLRALEREGLEPI
jgi:glutathione S-transferase